MANCRNVLISDIRHRKMSDIILLKWHNISHGSRIGVVGTTAALPAGRSGIRIPVRGKKFFSSKHSDRPLFGGYGGFFCGVNRLEREISHSPSTVADAKNE